MAKKKKGTLILNLQNRAKKSASNKRKTAKEKQATQKKQTNKKETTSSSNKTVTKRGGAVISQKSAQKKQAAQKANKSLKKAFNYTEGTGKVEKGKTASEAIEIGKKKSALGTKVEKKTGTVEVQKYSHPRTREKVEYEYTPMTMQEYTTMATGTQQGRFKETLNTNKDLKKKVTDLNVKDYDKGAFGMGVMDQMNLGLSVSDDPTFEYSDAQRKVIGKGKQSGKYTAGRVVGGIGEFTLGGTGALGSSIAKTGGKAVLKEAAEQGGKKLAKQTAKNIAKETGGDTVASLGLNTLDAVKFSYEDGKLNKEKFVKELALNVGGDIVIGGVVSGLVHGLSARQVSNFNRINKTLQKGGKVSDAEMKFYNKHVKELGDKAEQAVKEAETTTTAPKTTTEQPKAEIPKQMGEIVRESARRVGRDVDNDNIVKLAEKISGDTNTRIEFATNDDLVKMYGKTNIGGVVTEDGRMLINSDSDRALQTIIGHETSHILESTTQYNELKQLVKEYAESLGEYGSLVDEITDLYKGTNANIEDEVTAELIGKYLFTDDNFIRNLSATQPNTFQKIYQRIKDLLASVTKGSAEEKQLLAVQRKFEDAYREAQGVSKTSDRSRNLFVGEGKNLEYEGYSNLQSAKQMAEQPNADMEAIRQKTGWYRDGEDWKFEISDEGAKVNIEKLAVNGKYTLSDLFDHPKLYDAYPELKESKAEVYNDRTREEYGEVTEDGVIRINMAYNDEWEALNTFIHEVQHKIQNAENWYEGGDPDHFILKGGQSEYTKLLDSKRDEAIKKGDLQTAASYDNMKKNYLREWKIGKSNGMSDKELANSFYKRLSGEAEARDVEQRKMLTDLNRRRIKPMTVRRHDLIQLKNQGRGIRDVRGEENSINENRAVGDNSLYGNGAGRNKKATVVNRETDRVEAHAPSNQDIQTTTLRTQGESFFNAPIKDVETRSNELHDSLQRDADWEATSKAAVENPGKQFDTADEVFPTWEEISRKAYEVAEDEEKLVTLRKEYDTLKYKAQNTKNPEHYSEYIRRRWEIADILDEIAEKKKVKNVATPTRSTVEKADDLVNAANGTYKEDIKTLTKVNSRGLDNLYRIFVDTFHGFEQFARQLPKESRDIFRTQINAVRNSKNKAGGWLSEARVNAEGKRIGNSFNDIMGDLLQPKNAKKYEDFQYYCANKHNIDRYGQGKGVFGDKINAEESRKICEQLDKDYPDFAKKQEAVVEYFKDLQQARVDFGLISKETAEYLDALYSNYVPTYRVVEGKRVGISDSPKNTLEIGNVIKTATGGDSELLPLHEQVANLTEYTFKLGEQNRLMNLLATTQGVNVKSLDPSIRLEDAIDACTFTSKETDGATNKFYVAFFDGGAPRKVEVSEQMWLGIKEWRNDPDSLAAMFNWKAKHIRGANALFKNLITGWNPIFGVKNIVKDTGEALIYTKNVRGFIKAYPKAIAAVTKHGKYSKYFDIYQASGGKYAHIREDITTFNTDSTFKKVLKSPVELCQRFNDCLEAIPRMAEFISTIDSSLDAKKILKGGGSIDDVLSKMDNKTINRALYNANEVTLNFGRSGVASKALNSTVIPYLNPAIQGLDKLVRVFRDAGADGARGMLGLFGKIGAAAIVPAMFNEVMMTLYGGEDYQILNTRDKNNNYFIPMGDGKFIKIPKARVSAALASPFEHIYRHVMYGDSMEWKQMFSTAWTNVGVMNPLESSLFSPIMLALSNKTWYGGNIENASDLDLRAVGEKSEIYDATTSAIAIWIGDKVNMSPKKIDYIIDSYTGVIGDVLLPMTAEASNGNPLFKNFILDSVFSNKLATTFWEKSTTLEAYSEARGGEHSTKYEDWKAEYMYDALTINRAINDIDADKSLTKKEKAELKRELRKGLNKYYAAGTNGTSIDLEPVSFIAKHIGADKALTNYLPDSDNEKYSFKEHYKVFKELEGYSDKNNKGKNAIANEFLKTYKLAVETQKQIDVAYHNSPNWTTIAIANVIKGTSDNISLACGVYEDSLEDAKTYIEYGGDDKKYIATQKRINKIIDKLEKSGVDTSDNIYKKYLKSGVTALSLASGTTKFKDRAYFISYSDGKMNASRGLMSQYDWSISEVVKLGFSADADGNTYLKKQEVVDVIESSKASTREEKAMLFNIIYGDSGNNPYGSIGDYSLDGDTGITRDKETSSTGSSASKKSNNLPSWEDYIKDFISSSEATSGVKFTDWDSPLDKTYQNKIKAILKKMEV